jgi:hypothetical protein
MHHQPQFDGRYIRFWTGHDWYDADAASATTAKECLHMIYHLQDKRWFSEKDALFLMETMFRLHPEYAPPEFQSSE